MQYFFCSFLLLVGFIVSDECVVSSVSSSLECRVFHCRKKEKYKINISVWIWQTALVYLCAFPNATASLFSDKVVLYPSFSYGEWWWWVMMAAAAMAGNGWRSGIVGWHRAPDETTKRMQCTHSGTHGRGGAYPFPYMLRLCHGIFAQTVIDSTDTASASANENNF